MPRNVEEGEALFVSGNLPEARECFEALAAAGLRDARVLNNLGVTCFALGAMKEAEGYLLQALEAGDDTLQSQRNLVDLYRGQRRWADAARHLAPLADADPRDPRMRNELALVHMEAGAYAAALEQLDLSLAADPDQEKVRDIRAVLSRRVLLNKPRA